jgi:hypothetical protein
VAGLVDIKFSMFFDRKGVIDKMEAKERKVLARTGGFARKVMRGGMRRRKKISQPGEYPSAHAGQLKELIFFGYDDGQLVVGPVLFKGKGRQPQGKTVPELINEGGTVTMKTKRTTYTANYAARPFVDLTMPAAAKALADNMETIPLK